MAFWRAEIEWLGGPSSPGVSVFAVSEGTGSVDAVQTALAAFVNRIKGHVPVGYTFNIPRTFDVFQESNGQLIGEDQASTQQATQTSTGNASWAAGVGCRIDWRTASIFNGRRVRGRTYVVPLTAAAFETNGTLLETARVDIEGAGEALRIDLELAGSPLMVWHRPVNDVGGALHAVTQAVVPDKAAWLRGRRG